MPEPAHPNYRLQDLQRRWERDPSSRVYQQLAEEYRKADQLVEAAVVLEDGLGRRPNDIAARVALGRCRLDLGQTPEAIEALENVLARDAAHHVANKLLLDAYLRAGDLVQARERLNMYRLLNDRDPELEHLGFRLQQLEGGDLPAAAAAPTVESTGTSSLDPLARVDALAAEVASSQAADVAPHDTPVKMPDIDALVTSVEVESPAPLASVDISSDEDSRSDIFPREDPAPDIDSPPSMAVAFDSNHPQEALQMANRSADSKANDVFDFGLEAPVADSFAALWADLKATTRSAPTAEDVAAAPPQAVALEVEALDVPAVQEPTPSGLGDLAANPFGQLVPAAEEPAPEVETEDVWQRIADQGFEQSSTVAEPEVEAQSEALPPAQPAILTEPAALDPAVFEPAALDPAVFEPPTSESTEEPVAETLWADSGASVTAPDAAPDLAEAPTQPLEELTPLPQFENSSGDEEETRPLADLMGAPPPDDDAEKEPPQSPWEVAHQEAAAAAVVASAAVAAVASQSSADPATEDTAVSVEESPATEVASAEVPSVEAAQIPEPQAVSASTLGSTSVDEISAEMAAVDETPAAAVVAVQEVVEDEAEATVTLGSLYLKQGHREEAARIFEKILRRAPGNQAALAGLNLARKSEMSSLSAMDLLADQSLTGTIPADVNTKKILVLGNYLQHLKARSKESHVH